MVRFKKMPIREHEGKIIYGNGIVDGIVLLAIQDIPNVELYTPAIHKRMNSNSISVTMDKDGVHIDVMVKVHYSQCISEIAFKIQEEIRHNVETMTEYRIANVNVIVKGVIFKELVAEKPVVADALPENSQQAENKNTFEKQ